MATQINFGAAVEENGRHTPIIQVKRGKTTLNFTANASLPDAESCRAFIEDLATLFMRKPDRITDHGPNGKFEQ